MTDTQQPTADAQEAAKSRVGRRGFFGFFTFLVGAVVGLVPLTVAGIALFDPLRRKAAQKTYTRIVALDAVPDDGLPHRFDVVRERVDAWNRYPAEPVGAVYLVRKPGQKKPTAFTATCPHAGCFIGYTPGDDKFQCPCHTSAYHFDGTRIGGKVSVAPRGMDTLDVDVRPASTADAGGPQEVWVRFERFETGRHEKIALS